MKTRDRILVSSLALFNDDGEPGVTTVDIANELDISPGNLYYHFRGKEEIVAELLKQCSLSLAEALDARPLLAGQEPELRAEQSWVWLQVLFEEVFLYRFLYRDFSDIHRRYSRLRKHLLRLGSDLEAGLIALCNDCLPSSARGDCPVSTVARCQFLALSQWFGVEALRRKAGTPVDLAVQNGVLHLLTLQAPWLGPDRREFQARCEAMHLAATGL